MTEKKSSEVLHDAFVWTIKDVARELQVSERHIYKLMSQGRIPFAKVGRLVRFSPLKIRDWIERGGSQQRN